jgi:hypothetical protein
MTTAEQGAMAILEIFKSHKVGAGGVLMTGAVHLEYFRIHLTGDGFMEGVELACQRGWIEVLQTTMLKLTAEGLAEVQTDK